MHWRRSRSAGSGWRKGMDAFACKPVGKVEFTELARAVDPAVETRCVIRPPDKRHEGSRCAWEFTLEAS